MPARKSRMPRKKRQPGIELLEQRDVPTIIASQEMAQLKPPLLADSDVQAVLQRAAAATKSDDAIVAVVDRNGTILGVSVEKNVSTAITGNQEKLDFSIDGAVALARTAAFFASDQAPLTSRTIHDVSLSTMTQREVESDPNITDPNSPARGPGFVAAVNIQGNFPPNVAQNPLVDLFGIENTNRDSYLQPGADGIKGTPDDIPIKNRFNIDSAFVPAGQGIPAPLSYGESLLTPDQQRDPAVNHFQSRGIGTLPGGIPLYKYGTLVGGIGVFFPGTTGFATEENSKLSETFDPTKPDRSLEAEFIALAAAGGSSAAGFPVGTLGGIAPPPGFDIPTAAGLGIDLAGITLNVVGPGGINGPANLVNYANTNLGVGQGDPNAANFQPVDATGDKFIPGKAVPQGWLVAPHAGVNLSAADVQRIIEQGVAEAEQTRAQIRLPFGQTTRMVFAVTDETGAVLGLYRMPDATIFSIDVAVSKARNVSYYNDANQLLPQDKVQGVPAGTAFTNRTFRYLASPFFPVGINGEPPGPFSILNAPGINTLTGLDVGAPLPASAYDNTVFGFDAFHPATNFHSKNNLANQSGIVFFPGSTGVYVAGNLRGGFGVSGDGVDQDDFVTNGGINGFDAPSTIRVDQFKPGNVRLPYLKFPRNPLVK